jgi:hypothetical protein
MRNAATAATIIFVIVVVFISARKSEPPATEVPASVDADDNVAAVVAVPIDACAPCVPRSVTKAAPDTVTPRRAKNLRKLSMALANSRLATLSEQPTRPAAARWLQFWK